MSSLEPSSKRLLLVLPSLGLGGAERVASQLASDFCELGYQVLVLSMDDGQEDFFSIEPPAEHRHLGMSTQSQHLGQGLLSNWRRVQSLRQQFLSWKPVCIVGFTARVNVLCALASRGMPSKLILSERSYPPGMPLGQAWEALRRWSYRYADRVVAQTQVSARWLADNTSAKQVEIIPNGIPQTIDTKAKALDPEQRIPADKRLLLAVGRLVEEKGFDRLIQAMRELSTSHPQWQLVILGEGPLRQRLEALAANQAIQLPGRVGNLTQWYQRADLFVLSSKVEGFPNSLLEALAQGCPVVATDCHAGPADMVQPGVNGVLAAPSDASRAHLPSLGSALDQLMGNDALRQQMASNAKGSVQHLAQQEVLHAWQQLLES